MEGDDEGLSGTMEGDDEGRRLALRVNELSALFDEKVEQMEAHESAAKRARLEAIDLQQECRRAKDRRADHAYRVVELRGLESPYVGPPLPELPLEIWTNIVRKVDDAGVLPMLPLTVTCRTLREAVKYRNSCKGVSSSPPSSASRTWYAHPHTH